MLEMKLLLTILFISIMNVSSWKLNELSALSLLGEDCSESSETCRTLDRSCVKKFCLNYKNNILPEERCFLPHVIFLRESPNHQMFHPKFYNIGGVIYLYIVENEFKYLERLTLVRIDLANNGTLQQRIAHRSVPGTLFLNEAKLYNRMRMRKSEESTDYNKREKIVEIPKFLSLSDQVASQQRNEKLTDVNTKDEAPESGETYSDDLQPNISEDFNNYLTKDIDGKARSIPMENNDEFSNTEDDKSLVNDIILKELNEDNELHFEIEESSDYNEYDYGDFSDFDLDIDKYDVLEFDDAVDDFSYESGEKEENSSDGAEEEEEVEEEDSSESEEEEEDASDKSEEKDKEEDKFAGSKMEKEEDSFDVSEEKVDDENMKFSENLVIKQITYDIVIDENSELNFKRTPEKDLTTEESGRNFKTEVVEDMDEGDLISHIEGKGTNMNVEDIIEKDLIM